MLGIFVLYLREGIEASLIVTMLFAVLRQLGQSHQARAVWIGIGLAIIASIVGSVTFYYTLHYYDKSIYEAILETVTYLIAVVLLTTMTFWMQKHSRTMKKDIMEKASSASSGFALGLLAFTTVGREGIETAFFTLAFAFQTQALLILISAVLGLLVSIALSVLIYRVGYRLNYRVFFRVMGILLIFFAAGLLSNAIGSLQETGWLTLGSQVLWNSSHILSEDSSFGATLHGLIGYSDAPTILQGLFYTVYLLIAGGIFAWMTRHPGSSPAVKPTPAPESSPRTATTNG